MKLPLRTLSTGLFLAALPFGVSSAQGLAEVGPVSPDHGFPEWYADNNGLRLAPCITDTGLCLLDAPVEIVNPGAPFPANYGGVFADHAFYNVCEAEMESGGNGGLALLVISLQGGFATEDESVVDGQQDVFARFRVRVDNLIQGQQYTVTTPVGTFDFIAENSARRGINFTDDVGRLMPAVFGEELNGAIGPFLQWDSDLPVVDAAGREYLGDPAVEHTITGSPFGTNIFRIEGPSVGGPGVNMIETDLFSIIGLVSEDDGPVDPPVEPEPLTLSVTPGTAGVANTFRTSNIDGPRFVGVLFSPQLGTDAINAGLCGPVGLGLLNPRLIGVAAPNAGGVADVVRVVPPALAGRTLHMQTVDLNSCAGSNVASVTF